MKTIIEMVKGKTVEFTHYVKGYLWYETEDGFAFPVPISDCGDATFLQKDKATLFMRYIRQHMDYIKNPEDNISL